MMLSLAISPILASTGNIYLSALLHFSFASQEEIYLPEIYLIIIWIFTVSGIRFNYALISASVTFVSSVAYQIYFKIPQEFLHLHFIWMFASFSFGLLSALIINKFHRQTFLHAKELKSLLSQRELLMQELNHRVKNNLQFIITLLWSKRSGSSPETEQTLISLQSQISAIATVHETLCAQPDISALDTGKYLHTILDSLHELYPHITFDIRFEADIILSMERTITLGLVLCELISNSVKHSFTLEEGTIEINLNIHKNQVTLNYSDTITDYEENNFSMISNTKKSIGWSMISSLISQLRAISTAQGKYLVITFNL